jgi:hypothetical protein
MIDTNCPGFKFLTWKEIAVHMMRWWKFSLKKYCVEGIYPYRWLILVAEKSQFWMSSDKSLVRMSSDKSEDKSLKTTQKKTEDETLFSFATTVLNHWVWDGKHRSKRDAQTVFTLWISLLTSELQPYFLELVSRYHKALIYDLFWCTSLRFKLVFGALSQESFFVVDLDLLLFWQEFKNYFLDF